MEQWAIVLIITVVLGLLGILFIIVAALVSENKLAKHPSTTSGTAGTTGGTSQQFCTGKGPEPSVPPPPYNRISPKSRCRSPLSRDFPPFDTVTHTVQRLHRVRSLRSPISPNQWISNSTYGPVDTTKPFNVYPYLASIEEDSLIVAWPSPGTLTAGATGVSDLFFSSSFGPTLVISSLGERVVSCDILDIDALVVTAAWQYHNPVTREYGHLIAPLAKGSPFVTVEVYNTGASVRCGFDIAFESLSNTEHVISINESSGYVLVVSHTMTPRVLGNVVNLGKFTGVFRLAYFESQDMLTTLLAHTHVYPIESTIGVDAVSSDTTWTLNDTYTWTTATMYGDSDQDLLMMSLPSHNLTNTTTVGSAVNHPILGPAQFVTTPDDKWTLQNTLPIIPLEYPSLSSDNNTVLAVVWTSEIPNIIKSEPSHTAQWMAWIGSLAMMVLLGKMLNTDIGTAQTLLADRLNRIRLSRGVISGSNQLVYDRTWGGIIGKMGLNTCSGDFDSGSSFYNNPIGQFGYLVYAYAVMSSLDTTFREDNRAIALCFARHIANPCEGDRYFPLWRSKDWYLGYSISSGLQPNQSQGKETHNPGDAILGYYGCYLLASLLKESELQTWSASMLASEISAVQHYFQFTSTSSITVDPSFVQGTITERGDTYYNYTVTDGNLTFPARNASIMVPIVKPLSLASPTYLNETWTLQTQTWMSAAAAAPDIQPESLLYALGLMAVGGNNLPQITETIVSNRSVLLPYGSTWSSALYWAGTQ